MPTTCVWAADRLTVPTLTFKTLDVLVCITHARRELVHVNVTATPTRGLGVAPGQRGDALAEGSRLGASCVIELPGRVAPSADGLDGWVAMPSPRRFGRLGRTPSSSERGIGTLRRACLDPLIIRDEHRLWSVLREFVADSKWDSPHRTLGLQTPEPRPHPTTGPLRARPVLNGLHHVYERAA